jgi:FkbM family methyltransferase
MFDDLKTRSRRLLARKRQTAPVRALHRFAAFIDASYENDEWDMCANGETTLMRRLAPAVFTMVFDVGAHVGDWAIEAMRAWPSSRTHAFEVASPTFARLADRIAAAGLSDRTTLNCYGLADATERRDICFFPDHPNLTCDLPRHAFAWTPMDAQFVRGDEYVERHGIASIDFVKIDVEGAEHRVMRGLQNTLAAGLVACLQFEYGAFSIQTRVLLADYYQLLAPHYWIGKIYPTSVEFSDYDWTMESFRFSNFLCISRTRPDLKALAAGDPAAVAAVELSH